MSQYESNITLNESDVLNNLKKTIKCSICLEIMQNPQMLICSHVFCQLCINEVTIYINFNRFELIQWKFHSNCQGFEDKRYMSYLS